MSQKQEKSKPNTESKNQAGKGPEWRKGTNFQKYWNSTLWKSMRKQDATKTKKRT